ncbi:hypothetical protein M407DRAFT_241769 [Tulasnella calospora MUT 4182]|uniref:Uncharacterized protein n=1 Tax=Tulasnella calospora MUT 4182 TaxID=1051891 RepID=A0A0C3QHV9_9AGAM|nr:hypothetical protein M407DRAFT_241769 [Tulasnella calospora MUT 4182]
MGGGVKDSARSSARLGVQPRVHLWHQSQHLRSYTREEAGRNGVDNKDERQDQKHDKEETMEEESVMLY